MKHFFQDIPGWFKFGALYTDMVAQAEDGSVFVEVGSWKGRSAAFMAVEIINSGKDIEFHCVDTFKGSDEPAHRRDRDVRNGTLFEAFINNMAPVVHRAGLVIHPMTSVEASQSFDDKTVDFIMLDGAHDYESVKNDIEAWTPKLKSGATIGFDDWNWHGPKTVVNEFFTEYEVCGQGKGKYCVVRL